MAHHCDSASSYNRLSGPEVILNQSKDDGPMHDDSSNWEGGTGHGASSSEKSVMVDPPPPPKPTDERILQKIEVLCQFIAKNGPDFEDKARKNESGNPEFAFLFGGEPGSEAAIAHDYFLWMKKKRALAVKAHEWHKQRDSPLRPLEVESSVQPNLLMDPDASHSAADSDMEMEDDMSQPTKDEGIYHSFEGQTHENNELHMTQQLDAPQVSAEHILQKNAPVGNISSSGSLGLSGPGTGHDYSAFGMSISKVHCSVTNSVGAPECHLDSDFEKSATPLIDDLIPSSASAAASGIGFEKFPGQIIKGASPFRLLQDYASDDSTENGDVPCAEDVIPVTASPSVTADTGLHRDIKYNLDSGLGSERSCRTERSFEPSSEPESPVDVKEVKTSIATRTTDENVLIHENEAPISHGASVRDGHEKGAGGGVDIVPESGKSQKEMPPLKIDEFGRLVKEGASDSDSDDSRYARKRGKRGRSRSRSRSPPDRRRRRSPLRRKERRSRSRSWSPKKRRSRSKSPAFRRLGEYGGDKMKRDKGQMPTCFDFVRGRCYRGASCRYLHQDSSNRDGSRLHKDKEQYPEDPPNSNNINLCEGNKNIPVKISAQEHDENKTQPVQFSQDATDGSFCAPKDGDVNDKREENSARDSMQAVASDQHGKSGSCGDATAHVLEMQEVQEGPAKAATHVLDNENFQVPEETHQPFSVDCFPSQPVTDADNLKLAGDTPQGTLFSSESKAIQQSQANLSIPALQNAAHESHHVDSSSMSGSSPDQMPTTFSNKLPSSEPYAKKISSNPLHPGASSTSQSVSAEGFSSQSLAPRELSSPGSSAVDFPHHPSQLPPPPPFMQGVNAPHLPQPPRDYNLLPQTTNFPFQSASGESFSTYQASLSNQQSHFSITPNSSWTSMLPPPPPVSHFNDSAVNAVTVTAGVPLQYQQTHLPPRNEFISQSFATSHPTKLPTHSQPGEFQHRAYPPMQEPHLPPLQMEPKSLHLGNPSSQQFGGPSLVREDRFSQFPVQGLIPSSSFAQGSMYPQPISYLRGSPANKVQPFPVEDVPPGEILKSSSQIHTFSQQKQPPYDLSHSTSDAFSVHLGVPGKISSSMSRYPSDLLDRNQSSRLSDFGGSRISAHYNPYASTFEQPLSSKFSSNVFRQEKDTPYSNKYDMPFSLSHVPADEPGVGSLASRQTISSPNSATAGRQVLSRSGGDQYDPLFDSIEPSSNSFRKFDHVQKLEPTIDSDIMLRLGGSHKPLDVEENNKHKEVEAVAVTTSLENDEYGETADAEVGAVENGSPSSPIDIANTAAGEIEIDQIKSPGKSKKRKDSRSMKLFKVALADFVKEVLKPSWRQGNMSKEAFKTIVKKTVDKVSGAMKSHQIPKSQAKINHYIDSSQRKLTKLVMGYVDKYVKA